MLRGQDASRSGRTCNHEDGRRRIILSLINVTDHAARDGMRAHLEERIRKSPDRLRRSLPLHSSTLLSRSRLAIDHSTHRRSRYAFLRDCSSASSRSLLQARFRMNASSRQAASKRLLARNNSIPPSLVSFPLRAMTTHVRIIRTTLRRQGEAHRARRAVNNREIAEMETLAVRRRSSRIAARHYAIVLIRRSGSGRA